MPVMLAAEYTPSPLRLMLGLTRESGIGPPESAPIDSRFFLPGIGEGIPDLAGKQGIPESRFGRESGIGVPIRPLGRFGPSGPGQRSPGPPYSPMTKDVD